MIAAACFELTLQLINSHSATEDLLCNLERVEACNLERMEVCNLVRVEVFNLERMRNLQFKTKLSFAI